MIATYPELGNVEQPPKLETDETLQPQSAVMAQGIGSQLVPISFEVIGADTASARHNQYAYAAGVLFNNMDPAFVSIAGVPELGEDGHSNCLDTAVEYGDISKIVPVINFVSQEEQRAVFNTMDRYRAWGIEKVLVQPSQAELTGKLPTWEHNTPEFISLVREAGRFDSVGVTVRPENTATTHHIDEDYDRIAEELAVADFGITMFMLNPKPYIELVRAMREREVKTPVLPGIKPFRRYSEVEVAARSSGDVDLGEDLRHYMTEQSSPDQAQPLMTYFVGMGYDLIKRHDAPGLHIYTDNNVRAAQRLAEGVEQAVVNFL